MDAGTQRRITELLGSFLLGGAIVAMAYELSVPQPEVEEVAAPKAPDQAGSDDDDDADSGSIYAGNEDGEDDESRQPPAAGGEDEPPRNEGPLWMQANEDGTYKGFPPIFRDDIAFDGEAFPKYGLVTSPAVMIRATTDHDPPKLGIVRGGAVVRMDQELSFGGGCTKGWHEVYPHGWICLNAGVKVSSEKPDAGIVNIPDARIDDPMPYDYWRVSHNATPFFHRLPTFNEQDQADEAGQAWVAEKGREPMPTHPAQRPENVPSVVKEYLNAGYYVTVASETERSKRRFLRTIRGAYARKYQLEQREGSEFRGIVLENGAEDLPIYWIRRETGLQKRESEGSEVLVDSDENPERRSRYPFVRKVVLGAHEYYEDAEGRVMRAYAVGRARKIRRPPGLASDERWIHVDLSEQVLVAYIGDRPVFTTLVSTGKEPGMTPVGVHRVQSKHIATSMRDQPVEDEAYSIEDVPWTQYFHNNVALHGAFWHGGFGLVRSHGCVNLSPADARWLFGFTNPLLPEGWHSAYAGSKNGEGTAIVITE